MTAPLSPARAVVLVARREFTTQVKSRSFVIGLLITLVLFGGIGAFSGFVAAQSSSATLGVTPETAAVTDALAATADLQGLDLTVVPVDDGAGRQQVDTDALDALLTGSAGGYELLGRDTVGADLQAVVSTAVQQQVLSTALAGAGVDAAAIAAQSQVAVVTLVPEDPDRGQQLVIALVGAGLLFFSISGYGQVVATGVVEEKQSRVVELLLATIKPWQLLAGKVVGLGAVGLLQLVILGAIALAVGGATGLVTLPTAAAGMFTMVVVWYLLGFFLFASLYAALGSTVSRQEELGTLLIPMVFLLMIPFFVVINLLPNDPRNPVVTVLSFVPFFSPVVMPGRYAMGVAPLWEVLVAALVALLTIAVVVRLAGRVYANSILRTGARVGLREALSGRA